MGRRSMSPTWSLEDVDKMSDPLAAMVGAEVVLDTGTPIVYIGLLKGVTEDVFVLEQADMHDCRDGHAQPEMYVTEAKKEGVTANRCHVVVMRSTVISVSRLTDIVAE